MEYRLTQACMVCDISEHFPTLSLSVLSPNLLINVSILFFYLLFIILINSPIFILFLHPFFYSILFFVLFHKGR